MVRLAPKTKDYLDQQDKPRGHTIDKLVATAAKSAKSTQEMLVEEFKRQPESVQRELWHYLKFLTRQREEESWADVLPTREVEQEVLDIIDGHEPAPR
jgi:hypothetical protein